MPAVRPASPLFATDATIAGTVLETSQGHGPQWADRVVASLRPGERALIVLPFRPDDDGIGHRVAVVATPASVLVAPRLRAADHQVSELPSRTQYADRVRTALDWIAAGRLQKVVLGRSLEVRSDPPLDADAVVARLLAQRPGRYVFRVPLSAEPGGPVLLGASPELLVSRRGRVVRSLPLAGSAPRSSDPDQDRSRADALLESAKDRREHAFVVEAIVAALGEVCDGVVADEQRVVSTDTLHHLGTRIGGTLTANEVSPSALHLAQLLHPTPAIGGAPTASALQAIAELEEDRGPLTGVVGWVDGTGDGEFAVAIRAGVLDGDRLRLHAGAGIVAGSDPEAELRETGAKLTTMLKAVGL
ncbi:MAG: isochorismate synthase [Micropruina sp.]|uniref:isochorismate synthase n=1 Tax=Micropruina sp. TaxID=2737536 RepID=UPI0039E241B2